MSSCVVARPGSPDHEHECVDMLPAVQSDNSLPLTSTTPAMPAVIKTLDRPVVLYMAPVHKLAHEDLSPEKNVSDKLKNVHLK